MNTTRLAEVLAHSGLNPESKILYTWLAITDGDRQPGTEIGPATGLDDEEIVVAARELQEAGLVTFGLKFELTEPGEASLANVPRQAARPAVDWA